MEVIRALLHLANKKKKKEKGNWSSGKENFTSEFKNNV